MASTDRDALVALLGSTSECGWKKNRNWDSDADLWNWYGVTVNEDRVVKLVLPNNKLKGIFFPIATPTPRRCAWPSTIR